MKRTKNYIFISVLFAALLLAGLFLNLKKSNFKTENSLKPSQLDFAKGNELPAAPSEKLAVGLNPEIVREPSAALEIQVQKLNAADKILWSVFEDVLKSKNDNDPRLDQSLKKLSPAMHATLFEKYNSIPAENLSGRGLIVYLIARDLTIPEDVDFLKKVYQEAPCLSLADCRTVGPEDAHHSAMNQTTLTIAQLEGLYVIEKQLQDHREVLNNATYRNNIVQILVQAESFPVFVVREKAQSIRSAFEL